MAEYKVFFNIISSSVGYRLSAQFLQFITLEGIPKTVTYICFWDWKFVMFEISYILDI